jgi:S1-C subfamily serine protease
MNENILCALSDAMVRSVERAAVSTVRVDARRRMGSSGVVYQPGLVLAASHSVEREDDIRIELPDRSTTGARLLGRDPVSDLCLLGLESGQAIPASPAPREAQVGQFVLAVGRPDAEGIQASMGVVGAVGGPLRTSRGEAIQRFIRTDAIPYPGFSGGPLVDGDGQTLGINTSGFAPGASLAIPVALAWEVARTLQQYGRIRRGVLGVRSQAVELPDEAARQLARRQVTGLLLVGVERGQPAERAGLMVGDILVGMDGRPVEDHEGLVDRLAGDVAGRTVVVEVLRGGKLLRLDVTIVERH